MALSSAVIPSGQESEETSFRVSLKTFADGTHQRILLTDGQLGYGDLRRMADDSPRTVTELLLEWRRGDERALDRLMPLVYDELKQLARRSMRGERGEHTLQPTALVHEVYRRLINAEIAWEDRVHFFAVTARTMRRILVEHARAHRAQKRGGPQLRETLLDGQAIAEVPPEEILALDQALDRLAGFDERKSRAIELHYFGGMSYDETADALEISRATVHREMRLAKAWLQRELSGPDACRT
jgi:RNA polymerase sigma factor (TIGR02999 family)